MGYLEIIHMPCHGKLFPIHHLVHHTTVITVRDKAPLVHEFAMEFLPEEPGSSQGAIQGLQQLHIHYLLTPLLRNVAGVQLGVNLQKLVHHFPTESHVDEFVHVHLHECPRHVEDCHLSVFPSIHQGCEKHCLSRNSRRRGLFFRDVRTLLPPIGTPTPFNFHLEYDCTRIYGNVLQEIPKDAPEPLGNSVTTTTFLYANLLHDLITERSVTAVLQFFNLTPGDWYSKRQATVEKATQG